MKPNQSDPTQLARRVAALRMELLPLDPFSLAANTGSTYESLEPGKGVFHLKIWGRDTHMIYPEFVAGDENTMQELPLPVQALLLYYFRMADGTPRAGRWISFSELPDGRFYNQAFQGYTGSELARHFQEDFQAFEKAAVNQGGEWPEPGKDMIGEGAFIFQALPRVPLLAVFWKGDEDFPPSFQILFDASVSHYLPTDVCAILASMLTRRLMAARPAGS